MTIFLTIEGDPAPQGSKRIIKGRLIEASSTKLKKWRAAIAQACLSVVNEDHKLMIGPVRVEVIFYLPRPKSVPKHKRPWPIVPPDLDKLCRGLLDGIGQSEVIWGDDSQVIELTAWKAYADDCAPGAQVRIEAL